MLWKKIFGIALGVGLMAMACSASPGQGPGPVIYQPDIVGEGRLFMVALRVPMAAPAIAVKCPASVALLDKTPLPARSDIRRFYFRALKPAAAAAIVFALPGGRETVTIGIWSFEDLRRFRSLKGTQLPRRWPRGEALPELKT